MSKYICPLCNKIYYNVNDLASCTNKDAKAISEKEAELKRTKAKIESTKALLADYKVRIKQSYKNLSEMINKYNQAGLKLASLDPGSGAHCASSLTFSDDKNSSNFVDLRELNSQIKELDKRSYDEDKELNDLIEGIFGF